MPIYITQTPRDVARKPKLIFLKSVQPRKSTFEESDGQLQRTNNYP